MMSAAIRVLARAAAIQLEEMAATGSSAAGQTLIRRSALEKGKGRATDQVSSTDTAGSLRIKVDESRKGEEIIHEQQELLERDQLRIPAQSVTRHRSSPSKVAQGPNLRDLPNEESASAVENSSGSLNSHSQDRSETLEPKTPSQTTAAGSSSHSPGSSKSPDGLGDQFGVIVEEKPRGDTISEPTRPSPTLNDTHSSENSPTPTVTAAADPSKLTSTSPSRQPAEFPQPASTDSAASADPAPESIGSSSAPYLHVPPPEPSAVDSPLGEVELAEEDVSGHFDS